jgi:hypothetical protein
MYVKKPAISSILMNVRFAPLPPFVNIRSSQLYGSCHPTRSGHVVQQSGRFTLSALPFTPISEQKRLTSEHAGRKQELVQAHPRNSPRPLGPDRKPLQCSEPYRHRRREDASSPDDDAAASQRCSEATPR